VARIEDDMKKSTSRRLPHKLVLRAEAIAMLTPAKLGQVAGASVLGDCSHQSNLEVLCVGTNR
jgi:hypothetical protein